MGMDRYWRLGKRYRHTNRFREIMLRLRERCKKIAFVHDSQMTHAEELSA